MLPPENFMWRNAEKELCMNVPFVCFEESIPEEFQNALLETKCHLLLVVETAKTG